MSTGIKPWPSPMVESHGDYRAEAFLEDHIGGKLYSKQHSLPRLPIPSISETISRFLPTALPLAKTEEEKDTLIKACEEFEGQAGELQKRLIERKEGEMKDSSWLQLWWNTMGYLQVRDPVVVNVSYFFQFSDDGSLPPVASSTKSLGVLRAASLLYSAAGFRQLVASGELPHEAIGRKEPKTPLCSTAYKYMFNACRVPRKDEDTYRIYDPSLYTHAIVAVNGKFYSFDFVEKGTGQALPVEVIEDRIQQCVEMSKGGPSLPMIGYLTSDDRDICATARDALLRAGGSKMEEALKVLESGALMICLDENEEPVSKKQMSEVVWTGGLTSGHNRWFDKSIQIICTNNGKAGMCGEHSMMDGMPVVNFCDYVTKTPYVEAKAQKPASGGYESAVDNVKDIFGDLTTELTSPGSNVSALVDQSKANFDKLISAHELQVQSFQGYGSGAIKKMGYSPDAYVQMAMQLATYRLWGEQGGTYEATQVRPFLHGRTETTRTVSPPSEAFIKTMGLRPKRDEMDASKRAEKLELLKEAVNSHVKYIGSAAKAMGVDRHLLGLLLSAKEGETTPSLYSHPLYARSKTWRVSTSHLTHPRFDSWGYGEVTPDGVGLAYSIHPNNCMFCITALRENGGWPERLSFLLEEALLEMQTLNEIGNAPTSKL